MKDSQGNSFKEGDVLTSSDTKEAMPLIKCTSINDSLDLAHFIWIRGGCTLKLTEVSLKSSHWIVFKEKKE